MGTGKPIDLGANMVNWVVPYLSRWHRAEGEAVNSLSL